jgi:hypothetical protein
MVSRCTSAADQDELIFFLENVDNKSEISSAVQDLVRNWWLKIDRQRSVKSRPLAAKNNLQNAHSCTLIVMEVLVQKFMTFELRMRTSANKISLYWKKIFVEWRMKAGNRECGRCPRTSKPLERTHGTSLWRGFFAYHVKLSRRHNEHFWFSCRWIRLIDWATAQRLKAYILILLLLYRHILKTCNALMRGCSWMSLLLYQINLVCSK